ncbi:MAG: succinate dehydrogenase/fumarate reductase iron-sulfur subunit [Gammaproteobacteria bacterium]|nr:succinate dehydrogenase/fumarate reductase iron-sulfur subunit [Gammaproteobacteria bacterium]
MSLDKSVVNVSFLEVKVWRGKDDGELVSYQVPGRENQTVLDVVSEIQRSHEPSLAYRYACRVGVCGSCAMTVNGMPKWTCRTHVKKVMDDGVLTIEPLRNLPRIKDLVCDLSPFIDTWQQAGAPFCGTKTRHEAPANIDPESKARKAADAGLQCINCAVCYSACDVVSWNKDYIGPAGLNRAWTLVNDARHGERQSTFDKAFGSGGCGSCHSQGNCTRHCPIGLSPSESIAGLKKSALFGLPKV